MELVTGRLTMRKPTSEKIVRLIELKARKGFEFTVSRYSYRDMKLRQVVKRLTQQKLVNVEYRRDLLIVSLKV